MLVETEATLKVITVDERVIVVEYEESAPLESTGTVNVYSLGEIVRGVAAIASSAEVEMVVVKIVLILSNVTFVLIPLTVISVSSAAT